MTIDVQMWAGHSAYLEIADGAVVDFGGATSQVDDGHGWIAVDEIRHLRQPAPFDPPRDRQGPIERAASFDLTGCNRSLASGSGPRLADRLARSRWPKQTRSIARFPSQCSRRPKPKERE